MRYFLTLIFITNIGYSVYRYPELYSIVAEIAWNKAKDSVLSPLKNKAYGCFNRFVADCKNDYDGLVADCKNGCKKSYDGLVDGCRERVDGCVETVNDCKMATMSFGKRMTSVDSLYAMVSAMNRDTVEHVRDKVLPGDIYDINYVICYRGHCVNAHSRTLGKPHVSGSSIRYTLPTGQKYHFAMPEGEGTIKLKSAELIKS